MLQLLVKLKQHRSIIFCGLLLFSTVNLAADNAQANQESKAAYEAAKEKDYSGAGKKYLAAELYADDPVIKANAVKAAANSYRKAKLYYKEFECLEKLIQGFPSSINFEETIEREFEIGNRFFRGYREPAFSWTPWIRDKDRTIEIYVTALKNGPFSQFAPEARLRLGRLYIEAGKLEEAFPVEYFKIKQ